MLIRRLAVALLVAVACVQASAEPLRAREWFIKEGSEGGDGSLAKPFADPWMALEKAEAGDVVHVTGGKYFGKLNGGYWEIPFDNIQLIGGYDKDFKTRDPWTNRTELLWDKNSKNRFLKPRLSANGAKNCVVDGIVIDMKDFCTWTDESRSSRKDKPLPGENAMDFNQAVTIRNCVIVNPDGKAITAPPGSLIENNVIFNSIIFAVSIYTNTGDFAKNVATVKDNTILYTWGFKEPGKGGYDGAMVHINGPALVTNNILMGSDSNSIYQVYKAEKISITKNVFFQNMFSNVKAYYEGKDVPFDDKNMGDMEELGYKACDGNEIANPEFTIDPAWLDLYTKRTAYSPGKVTMDDMNKLRQLMGLPLIAKGGTPASGVAPVYDLDKVYAFLEPKNAKVKAGARRKPLESLVKGSGGAAASTKTYAKAEFLAFLEKPAEFNGKEVEFLVGLGEVANVGSAPASYKKETITGYKIWDKDGSGKWTTAFMTKGTNAARLCEASYMDYRGGGKPATLFVAKGIAYETTGYPKHMFYIETIEKYDPSTAPKAARPKGRDWFIVMGAAGGNGSKEKPFKDPWQALEKCESGDTIHIAEGEYYGKLKIGMWKIDTTYISLIGGYDKEFKERNPWTHPTLLFCPPDFKGNRGGYMIEGEGDHTGAVVDGIIFDKKTNNKYRENGDIDRDKSDAREHIWLFYPDVAIRNCVFLNGNGGALRVCNGATIENNIFINHMNRTINQTKGHTTLPSVIRNNTLMFSWEMKFGEGRGRGGNLLRFESDSRAIIDNNVLEFADNDAVVLSVDPQEIVFSNNVFSHNLYSHVSKTLSTPNTVVDGANFKQLGDLGWKKSEGNVILPEGSGCPVSEKFFNVYLSRTAYTPGKVTMDEWNQLREMLGQPVLATGGKGPEGFMPLYDWKDAIKLFPKNPKCKAGARIVPLEVKFEGIERKEETFEYAETNWDAAKDRGKWDALDKKRVQLKIAIKPIDNQYQLDDIKKDEYTAFQVMSFEDAGGLPMRCYIKKGTKFERVVKNAKDFATGKPEESYIIKGIARSPRQMVVEVVERAD